MMLEWLKEALGAQYTEAIDRRVSEEMARAVEQESEAQWQVTRGWEQKFLGLQAEVKQRERTQVAEAAIEGLCFSSESAKKAFLGELQGKGLPIKEGKLEGFDAFLKTYQEQDAAAFAPPEGMPRIVGHTPGGAVAGESPHAQANSALRAVFGKG